MPVIRFWRDRKVRDVLWQALATVGLVVVVVFFVRNASDNMVKAGIASGFQFLWRDSGIEVPFNITGYKPSDTILALLWTGIVNTLLVSAAAVVVATVVGFTVGLMRLSHNWLLSTPCRRLYRVRPQHPAAVLRAVLVLRRAGGLADAQGELRLPWRCLSEPSRPVDPAAQRRRRAFASPCWQSRS